jgi:hypothetical protein
VNIAAKKKRGRAKRTKHKASGEENLIKFKKVVKTNNRPDLFEAEMGSDCGHSSSLNIFLLNWQPIRKPNLDLNVTFGQQFDGLQCGPVLADQSHSAFHKTLPFGDHRRDFYYVTEHLIIVEHSARLNFRYRYE